MSAAYRFSADFSGKRACRVFLFQCSSKAEYPTDIVLLVVRWRLQDKLSLRDLAQMFRKRAEGLGLEHSEAAEVALLLAGRRPGRGSAPSEHERVSRGPLS